MNHLILVGCSLGEQWSMILEDPSSTLFDGQAIHPFSLEADRVSSYMMGGGGNAHGVHGLLNEVLMHGSDIKNMRIVCQLTGVDRKSIVMEDDKQGAGVSIKNALTGTNEKIMTDGGHTRNLYGAENMRAVFNTVKMAPYSTIRDLTSILCMLGSLGADVYVFRGWEGCMPKNLWKTISKLLNSHSVITYPGTYMDVAVRKSVSNPSYNWLDDKHPGTQLAAESITWLLNQMVKEEKLIYVK